MTKETKKVLYEIKKMGEEQLRRSRSLEDQIKVMAKATEGEEEKPWTLERLLAILMTGGDISEFETDEDFW